MRTLIGTALAFLLIAPLVRAADVSGKWTGSADLKTPDGDAQSLPVQAEFKRQDKSLSGSIGKAGEEQWPIAKGKIEDGKIGFQFQAPEGDEASGKRLYTVRLTVVSETQLQGEFDFEAGGNKVTGKLTLTRDK